MNKTTRRTKTDDPPPVGQTRNWLAFGITGVSIVGVIILGTTIIIVNDAGVTERAQNVFNAVLPLLGTWVGTVLAYFFSRENFESASRSVERLTQQLTLHEKLESMPVTSAMTPRTKMLTVNEPGTAILLDVLTQLESKKVKRLQYWTTMISHKPLYFERESLIICIASRHGQMTSARC